MVLIIIARNWSTALRPLSLTLTFIAKGSTKSKLAYSIDEELTDPSLRGMALAASMA